MIDLTFHLSLILQTYLYREVGKFCGESNIAPFWKIFRLSKDSTEAKINTRISESDSTQLDVLADVRTLIYETEDNNMKIIQNIALYVLALNCGIIAYWFGQYQPIFNDFQTNHGAKNENGERNGQPRSQIGKLRNVALNRFIILVSFLSKILIPFVDSITGKSNRQSI